MAHGNLSPLPEADEHPLKRLSRHQLPQPARRQEVAGAFERWVQEHEPDANARLRLLSPSYGELQNARERALSEMLWFLNVAPEHQKPRRCAELADKLASIQRELNVSGATVRWLNWKAAKLVEARLEKAWTDTKALLSYLEGTPLKAIQGNLVQLPFGVQLPMAALLDQFGQDSLALFRLREMIIDGTGLFDEALAERADALTPILVEGIADLFGAWPPKPEEYLAAFSALLPGRLWVPAILRQLGRREHVDDGFHGGPDGTKWLTILAGADQWEGEDLKRLARLPSLFEAHPEAYGRAMFAGLRLAYSLDDGAIVFAALSMLLLSRRRQVSRPKLAEVERHEALLREVAELPLGEDLLFLDGMLAVLPQGKGAGREWAYLAEGEKKIWQLRVREHVEQRPDLCFGVAEYLLTWSSREVYGDVEPLVVDVLAFDRKSEFLRRLARSSPHGVTSLRAECLVRELILLPP